MPPPKPQSQNKTSQEVNGDLTEFTEVLEYETFSMAITVVDDMVLVPPVINPPEVAPFPFKIDLPPSLPQPLPLPSPPHVPPPLSLPLL